MSDCKQGKYKENTMNDYHLLTHDQLMKENYRLQTLLKKSENDNIELLRAKAKLENELYENKKWTATVYEPNKPTYKELEDKLALAANSKQTAIDDLYETQIIPLKNQVKEKDNLLDVANHKIQCKDSRIKQIEQIIKDLNTRIDFAVGYISATQPHTDKHPMEVKRWLFEGLEGLNENINKPI